MEFPLVVLAAGDRLSCPKDRPGTLIPKIRWMCYLALSYCSRPTEAVLVSYLACRGSQAGAILSRRSSQFLMSDGKNIIIFQNPQKLILFQKNKQERLYFTAFSCIFYGFLIIFIQTMRAYAVVKKQPPSTQEHVIRFTKEEPKISIEPISQNRFVALHKGAGELPMHQLVDKGSYFRFNYDASEKSQRLSERNNQEINDQVVEGSVKSQKLEEAILQVQQQPKQPKLAGMPMERSVHKVPRTKRLFQEFSASPALHQSFNQSNGKDTVEAATPVKAINQYKISSFPPVQAQPVLSASRSSKANNLGEMIRMEKEVQLKPQIYENYEDNNVTYQSNSKNVFCCGGSLLSSESNHEVRPQPQRRTNLFVPLGSGDVSNSPSSHKRKIFEEFQPKSNNEPAISEEFTFKEPKLGGHVIIPDPQQKKIKVKIYEFPNTAPFDI